MKPGSEPQVLIDSFLKRRANYGSLEAQSAPDKHRYNNNYYCLSC